MMNFYPKSIVIQEDAPRVLELRPPQDYKAGEQDLRPFDMHSLNAHAPVEWMVDMEGTPMEETQVFPEPIDADRMDGEKFGKNADHTRWFQF